MNLFPKSDISLKIGNLAIAGVLSLVPVTITLAVFYIYGLNICNYLAKSNLLINKNDSILVCNSKIIDLNYRYIIFIWLFITLPTWGWFYLNHARRLNKNI